jgi:hypothetical protein
MVVTTNNTTSTDLEKTEGKKKKKTEKKSMSDLRKELCHPPSLSIGCGAAFAAHRFESKVPKLRVALARSTTNPRLKLVFRDLSYLCGRPPARPYKQKLDYKLRSLSSRMNE